MPPIATLLANEALAAMSSLPESGRFNTDDPWFELYERGIELGTWDVDQLFETVGVKDDIETWKSLTDNQQEQWARLISAFLDLEHQVAEDGVRVQEQVTSPYYDNRIEKQMYASVFTMTEVKHTQFFDRYVREVMGNKFQHNQLGARHGGMPMPRTEACGISTLGERQGALAAKAANGGDPRELARAAVSYHLSVEGIAARGAYHIKNNFMQTAPLPLLNKGFQFISTDEGRHVTHGLRLCKELVEKEQEGIPEYQGVQKAIWDEAIADIPHITDTLYFLTKATDDPLGGDFDSTIQRSGQLFQSQYGDFLDLDPYDFVFLDVVDEQLQDSEEKDYEVLIKEYEYMYEDKLGEAKAKADGGWGEGGDTR